ncbi:hypothetical protein [Catenuloplanes japonicus]|uniref:hypothetical protein n=1 Tax=Catenuloplanes japonicus TaxID=33876 RepID=UPI00052468A8|nr:hypothetical protein [Catenuloplanes japonicus]
MRVGVVGLGVIGRRTVAAVLGDPRLRLRGVAVRSVPAAVSVFPGVRYFADDPQVRELLRQSGAVVAGALADLLADTDAIVDAGPARSGASRASAYRVAGVRVVFCGGERSADLGPLVHPDLNADAIRDAAVVRLVSCNTTALSRMIAAFGPAEVSGVEATVLRCATDTDKAGKGRADGLLIGAGSSHHGADLAALRPGLRAVSAAVTVPMVCGHVIDLRVRCGPPLHELRQRLASRPRICLREPGESIDTAVLRAEAGRNGRRWGQRFELVVRPPADLDPDGRSRWWLALDNESITVPELMDVLGIWSSPDSTDWQPATDARLGIGPPYAQ